MVKRLFKPLPGGCWVVLAMVTMVQPASAQATADAGDPPPRSKAEKPTIASQIVEGLMRTFVKPPKTAEEGLRAMDAAALRPASYAPPKKLSGDVVITKAVIEGWPVYTIAPRGTQVDKVVVYVHGGAFYGEIEKFHWNLCARMSAETGSRVIVPIYPLAPRGTAKDVVAKIASLTSSEVRRMGRDAVSLAGDSAGGNIALAAAQQLGGAGIRLRQIVLIHPAVDLSLTNPEIDVVQRQDPVLRKAALLPIFERWADGLSMRDPRVSPLYGDMSRLGSMTIFSGTHDITNPDTRLLVRKAESAGVNVVYHEGAGLTHPSPALPTPEGKKVRQQIVEALR